MPDSANITNIIIIAVIEDIDLTVHLHAVHTYLDIFLICPYAATKSGYKYALQSGK